MIGSANFATMVSKSEKSAFPRERKTAPLEVNVGGKKVFSLRWLKTYFVDLTMGVGG